MGQYILRRLLIAIPSLLGISVVLFTLLALAPGDPFEELATNPAVPPEVRMALRAKFGLDDPVPLRYVRWITAMAHGDWGSSFVSRIDVDDLILQRLDDAVRDRHGSDPRDPDRPSGGVFAATRPYSLFDQIANTFASSASRSDILHRAAPHLVVQYLSGLAALRLSRKFRRPAGDGTGNYSARRLCRLLSSACSWARRRRATCAPQCSM